MKFVIYLSLLIMLTSPSPGQSQPGEAVDPISVRSLKLEIGFDNQLLGTATGFIVLHNSKHYLITNLHVVSGKDMYQNNKISDPNGRTPNMLNIWHHASKLGSWLVKNEPLYENGKKRWHEISVNGQLADVVALPLSYVANDIMMYPFDLDLDQTDMVPIPGMPVQIVGFPGGMSAAGLFPIWKTGHIASDPDTNFNDWPAFLIDATTRGGMSGSPVVLRLGGGYKTHAGLEVVGHSGFKTLFLGIYAGQSQPNEVGVVWKPIVIRQLLKSIN
ncbi:S1 family peptidase [Spirosoma oryzicola]|uniref:S1 family peptidase n=1 Tax=Spirosoma oryzicola TaxID=2898794 RepID=UPI001E445E57|nr:serine protease [Spirosoma oryzicola]UHG93363.1 serine protease [Spirosoma oryzicola]